MSNLARKKDPATSKAAAKKLKDSGRHTNTCLVARQLVRRYKGYTYRHLWDRHRAECERRNVPLVFEDAPSLMRRLCDVAKREGLKMCPVSGLKVSRWWPK